MLEVITAALLTLSGNAEAPTPPAQHNIPEPQHKAIIAENTVLGSQQQFKSFDDDKTYAVTGKDLLSNTEFHSDLAWMTYDNIPEPYHKQLLTTLETRFDETMHNTTLPDSTYRDLPTPVRHVNLLNRLSEHVDSSSLSEHYKSADDAIRAMGATIMTESFFNQDATNPTDTAMNEADVGYGQASPWVRSYLHREQGFPAPTDSTWFDVDTQVDFITAWFETNHEAAEQNAVAHAAYNTGISRARDRTPQATEYYSMWWDRRQTYFEPTVSSQTQQWVLDQAGLDQE